MSIAPEPMPCIAPDSHVTLHYRVALLVQGTERELVNTFGGPPATLQMGVGQWSPFLEHRLVGLAEGEGADFEVPAPEAYGERFPGLVREVRAADLRSTAPGEKACDDEVRAPSFVPGEEVAIRDAAGRELHGVFAGWGEGGARANARVDFNHPLAGAPLRLAVQVLGVL
jgi:FKBP-type peptidyl-prolyl cis-trans isomerase SlpA